MRYLIPDLRLYHYHQKVRWLVRGEMIGSIVEKKKKTVQMSILYSKASDPLKVNQVSLCSLSCSHNF